MFVYSCACLPFIPLVKLLGRMNLSAEGLAVWKDDGGAQALARLVTGLECDSCLDCATGLVHTDYLCERMWVTQSPSLRIFLYKNEAMYLHYES